jgi:hypothetical protein
MWTSISELLVDVDCGMTGVGRDRQGVEFAERLSYGTAYGNVTMRNDLLQT